MSRIQLAWSQRENGPALSEYYSKKMLVTYSIWVERLPEEPSRPWIYFIDIEADGASNTGELWSDRKRLALGFASDDTQAKRRAADALRRILKGRPQLVRIRNGWKR